VQDLKATLKDGNILIADGATGTMLQAMGLPAGAAPELWNIERPDAIRAHHRAYLDAGSGVILTNTFGGTRIKLERAGALGKRAAELNEAAAALARAEAGDGAYVAGDIGPTGELLVPYGMLSYDEAVEVFAEQAGALVAGGVDLIWVETMTDLNEAKAAIAAAQQVCGLPIFCSLSFGRGARTMMGVTPEQALETLWPLGLTAIGANCGDGVEPVATAIAEMHALLSDSSWTERFTDLAPPALIAKPNAGVPHLENGSTVFDLEPKALAAHAPRFVELGAQVIGACCGSSPDYIAAIAAALSS
jgi:5-methyltetrahydrofolate--homocysteine methyltransferase